MICDRCARLTDRRTGPRALAPLSEGERQAIALEKIHDALERLIVVLTVAQFPDDDDVRPG